MNENLEIIIKIKEVLTNNKNNILNIIGENLENELNFVINQRDYDFYQEFISEFDNIFIQVDQKFQNVGIEEQARFYFNNEVEYLIPTILYQVVGSDFQFGIDENGTFLTKDEYLLIEDNLREIEESIQDLEEAFDIDTNNIEVVRTRSHGYFWKYIITDPKCNGEFYSLSNMGEVDQGKYSLQYLENKISQEFKKDGILKIEISDLNRVKSGYDTILEFNLSFDFDWENSDDDETNSIDNANYEYVIPGMFQGKRKNYMELIEFKIQEIIQDFIDDNK